jgi:hypothetical protein
MRPLSLPDFDPVEVVRGTVASLSVTDERTVHETNIRRIQQIFSRTGLPSHALKSALEDIRALREAEHLGKGYWLPTPTRAVSLYDDTSLLVSIAPTTELQRHFPSVKRAGLGRLVATVHVNHLPIQSLKSWRGASDLDTPTWARAQIESATNNCKPSIAPADIEAFSVKTASRATHSTRREPAWLSIADHRAHRVPEWKSVSLFRTRLGSNTYRYFLGKITRSRALLEGPAVTDPLSMQYGLASLLREPLTVATRSQDNLIHITLPLSAPRSVRRLLSALCDVDTKTFGYVWLCSQPECWPTTKSALQELGCEIANYE